MAQNAAYQLNGTIHISDSWANNGFSNFDFAHEYGHYLQQEEIGTANYLVNVAIPSVISAWTNPENHSSQSYEIDATERGIGYMNNNSSYINYYPGGSSGGY